MSKSIDRLIIEELYRRYGALVERRCLRILGNPSEAADASQEVFLRLIDRGSDFRQDAEWMTWLYRVATNVCLNRLRGRAQRDEAWLSLARGPDPKPHPAAEEAALVRETLAQLLVHFDEKSQAIAIHYFLDEMSQEEIGELIGMSRVSVNKRLMKFREIARGLLEQKETA